MMKLAANFELSAIDYANQGNSIIGIRGSGKTYTATKIAEQLMTAGIPIIAFDPTGLWQNLRFGVDGRKGFSVVVAGGMNGDLPLSEENVTQIIDAALTEGVSLIIDLQGTSTSNKSKWLRIVSESIEYLMGNNQAHGLRHIFIEEAAEFVPQKPSPGGALVYSRIESMARIGRNFGLGYTLINQRAEEIAKAVFEISELVLIHRQSGKNSLNSIKDWLSVRGQAEVGIVQTLPKLESGECWGIDNTQEVRMKILPKFTFHPDPKKGQNNVPAHSRPDVSKFIFNMMEKIESPITQATQTSKKRNVEDQAFPNLIKNNPALELEISINRVMKDKLESALREIRKICDDVLENKVESPKQTNATNEPKREMLVEDNKAQVSTSGINRMLKAAAMYFPKPITKQRMASLSTMSVSSGTFGTYLASLKKNGYLVIVGSNLMITESGIAKAGNIDPLPTDPLQVIEMWCQIVGNGSGAARILRFLGTQYPKSFLKIEIGRAVEMSSTSGSFGTYLSTLKKNNLISIDSGRVKASDDLFN
jgi:hypothetical protein